MPALLRILNTPRARAICWFVLGAVLVLRFPVNFYLHPPFLMDFDLFRAIGQRLVAGQAAALYAPVGSAQSLFKYAPCWALGLWPFAFLSLTAGSILWALGAIACLLGTGYLALRLCQAYGLPHHPLLFYLAIGLLIRPVTAEFLLGQTNLVWGGLLCAFAWYYTQRRPGLAGLCLALAIALKLPAALILCWLALRREWRLTIWSLAWFFLLNGAAAVLLLPSNPGQLFDQWWQGLATSGPDRAFEIGNQSLLALTGRLLRNDGYGLNVLALPAHQVFWIAAASQALLWLGLFWPSRRRSGPSQQAIFDLGLLTVLMALCSPTTWIATYTVALWPVTWGLAWLQSALRQRWPVWALLPPLGLTLAFSLMTHAKFWRWIHVHHYRGESYVYLVFMTLPLLGLSWVWTLWLQRRLMAERRPSPPEARGTFHN